jgi:acyl transferase domain-containing protein
MSVGKDGGTGMEIAIIGMSCYVPGASSVEEFWDNLRSGVESISFFSERELLAAGVSRETFEGPDFVPAGGVLEEIARFDAPFFGYTPREAELIDPQQRLFLEHCWAALERAGYDPGRPSGPVGVFAGSALSTYLHALITSRQAALAGGYQTVLSNDKDFLATRVAYKLGLEGPAIGVQTACSTSLAAVHVACQSLLAGECDMALAGGVSILVPQRIGYRYQPDAIHSRDGHCRAFDASASGTVGGSGIGVVVLKRLADALAHGDRIDATIKASAINNDGSGKVGFTAPRIEGQAAVIRTALSMAEVSPDSIGYVEAHGTGTLLGDPIEVKALTRAFRSGTTRTGFCAIGSVKTNVGHLDAAAGVVGLIKAALMLRHGELVPSLHFERPNPKLELASSPFYVATERRPWPASGGPRRAGVSSFGIGGTNVHVVLEEPPPEERAPAQGGPRVLVVSATTASALEAATERLASHRRAVVSHDTGEAAEALEKRDSTRVLSGIAAEQGRRVAFAFPGQGAQHPGMARDVYAAEPAFRAELDRCCERLQPLVGLDLRPLVLGHDRSGRQESASLDDTRITQPALFAVEYALARLWMSWGIEPEALIGHSVGEYVAACLAGVMGLDDALMLVATRGRLMQQCAPGAMLAVALPPERARALMTGAMSLAAHNAPDATVIAGPLDDVARCERRLQAGDVPHVRLATSHAFHSPSMDAILPAFAECVARVRLGEPQIPFVSNLTGSWIRPSEARDPAYWTRHLRETVRFSDGLATLLGDEDRVLLEVGPGDALTSLARRSPEGRREGALALPSLPHRRNAGSDHEFLLAAAARLWIAGGSVDLSRTGGDRRHRRVLLPSYPFEGERYWVQAAAAAVPAPVPDERLDPSRWLYSPSWRRAEGPAPGTDGDAAQRWAVLLDRRGVGAALVERLRTSGHAIVTVLPARGFARLGPDEFTVDPGRPEHFARLVDELSAKGAIPQRWVHLWGLGSDGEAAGSGEGEPLELGFYSLLGLGRALGERTCGEVTIAVVTRSAQDVTGEEALRPAAAAVAGPCRVLPQEYPLLRCRLVDLAADGGTDVEGLERLHGELTSTARDPVVSYRGRYRWVPTFERMALPPEPVGSRLRPGGAYLITEGLGRVGLALARHLARAYGARLSLTSRNGLPERADWDEQLSAGPDLPLGRRIRAVRELEELGAQVVVIAADVADPAAMRGALELTRRRFGRLDGVIHAAGAIDSTAVRLASQVGRTECEAQFHPKLHGARVLAQVLADERLDFVMLTSSLASVLGGLGFSAYAAANHALDCFAHEQHRRGHTEWISVNWDGWQTERGESVPTSISTAEGGASLERILALPRTPQVAVSTTDLGARLERWVQLEAGYGKAVPEVPLHPRPELHSVYLTPETATEKRVAQIWGELLGIESVGVNDNFFELGGSSLLAIQLVAQLKREFRAEISVASLFEAPTVRTLSEMLDAGGGGTLDRGLEHGRVRSQGHERPRRRPDEATG